MGWVKQKKERGGDKKVATKLSSTCWNPSMTFFVSAEDETRESVPLRHALLPAT
jgi:hypothetical protein